MFPYPTRFFLHICLIVCLLPACQSAGQPSAAQPPCAGKPPLAAGLQPNILFILTDDLDSSSLAYMPKVKALLVDQGVQMTNYLINLPLCCPSRSTTLLGQYSHNTQILTNGGDTGGYQTFYKLDLEKKTIAVDLQRAGYRTVLLGKYLNGYPKGVKHTYVPPGWTHWYSPVGGDAYAQFKYKLNEDGEINSYKDQPEDYMMDVLTVRAVDFLRSNVAEKQPFFMYMATYSPHGPAVPAPRHAGLFTDQSAPRTAAFNETDVSDKPQYVRDLQLISPEEQKGIDSLYVSRLQSLQAVDEMVGQLVQVLQDTGQLENTYIIFTSDNGFHMGQHRLRPGKATPYEEDVRVPMVIRGPGIPAGQTRSELTGNVDLAPTFAALAGVSPSSAHDGRSLLPLLLCSQTAVKDWRQAYLLEHWASKSEAFEQMDASGVLEPPDPDALAEGEERLAYRPAFKGLRTADYLYVEYATGERELYDLRVDPDELDNLAGTAAPALLKQLSQWLSRLSTCKARGCQAADLPT
jgi:N-acetylglucosamine-6-sulfatase